MKPKRVLIVESEKIIIDLYVRWLPDVTISVAGSITEALELFEQSDPFDCIVVCGMLSASEPSTVPLVQKLKKEVYKGPIVAASNNQSTRKELLDAGCTHAVPNSKTDTSALVRELLNI